MDPKTKDYKEFTELLPLGLVGLVLVITLVITLCPFNIIYRSSRFFLLQCAFHCLCAPFYKVQAIRRENTCTTPIYNTFYFIVAVIPYLSHFLQCLRCLFEEKDAMQGYNGMKYFSTIVAVSMMAAYNLHKGMVWWVLAWITSAIAAAYGIYWDIVVDWGLLHRNSKNRWLRDKLILPHKSIYFGAMILNILLRFAWLQTVLNFGVPFLHRRVMIAIVASLEIIRRGMLNFFRLENEHLNNVGKYHAFKSVPLPFNYNEDEDKDYVYAPQSTE